jgi:hypothetical protein
MAPEPTEQASRRGCVVFSGAIALIVLALIAISLGWIGPIDRGKEADLPVIGGNQV